MKKRIHRLLNFLFFVFLALHLPFCESDKVTRTNLQDWMLTGFEKVDSLNPILVPSSESSFRCPIAGETVRWQTRNVLNPAAVVRNDSVFLFFRAQDSSGTSRIGIAVSTDGLHFQKQSSPVLFPDKDSMNVYEWNYKKRASLPVDKNCVNCLFDGVEDPRIIQSGDGSYIMTYTAYDGKTARLCVATSNDLLHWVKKGLAFKQEKYQHLWSKSGAIVAEMLPDGRLVARKIKDSYWMYFGDTNLFVAKSPDLISWTICERAESGEKLEVLSARPGYFDSRLVEPGPFALYREGEILLIYNASNAANFNDPDLPKFTYAAGQALFDGGAPYKLKDRCQTYFIHPDKPYEKVGEVNEVCFVEGLIRLRSHWFLYYGTADSRISVAVAPTKKD